MVANLLLGRWEPCKYLRQVGGGGSSTIYTTVLLPGREEVFRLTWGGRQYGSSEGLESLHPLCSQVKRQKNPTPFPVFVVRPEVVCFCFVQELEASGRARRGCRLPRPPGAPQCPPSEFKNLFPPDSSTIMEVLKGESPISGPAGGSQLTS